MNSFIIYLLTFLSGSITLTNLNTKADFVTVVTNEIAPSNVVSLSIQKLDNVTFNLMAYIDISYANESEQLFCQEDFESILVFNLEENEYLKADKPIVATFRNCKNPDGSETPIKTVRVEAMIHLTKKGEMADSFKLNGATQCTMEVFCNVKETGFEIIYEEKDMTVITEYVPLVYSN